MHRLQLLTLLSHYTTRFMDEAAFVKNTLDFVQQHENCFDRELQIGHVTGSAWVVSRDRQQVLLLHHKKLDQWFQPGGHADGEADIVHVALKETAEESGLPEEAIHLVSDALFDVDIHTIAANLHDNRHLHFDIRFLVEVDERLPVPGNDESHQILWVPLYRTLQFNNNRSTYRMLEKTRRLQLHHFARSI
ncbi:NUDIX domain-containing protein [Ectothiorhodospiraceae bacterium BW-2]|nr:NUDIX domain-containing protein [Ectothiorhodospiraceae bacterium BW-2]